LWAGDLPQEKSDATSRKDSNANPKFERTELRGYPAPLKNALDHLHKQWAGKPAVIAFGGHGGNKSARQISFGTQGLSFSAWAVARFFPLTMTDRSVII
jgi:hypothetical protein